MKKRILTWLLAISMLGSLLTVPAGAAAVTKFSDVSDSYTATAVEALRLMGVLDGYGDGTFRPDTILNRAQFCKMAVYAMDGSGELGRYSTVTIFPDVKPSHWASAYINMAARKGIISGFADGKFKPGQTVTAGQAVTILMRGLGYKDEDMGGVWPQSYMAEAQTNGLLKSTGITSAYAGLTRAQAARLFLNLFEAKHGKGEALFSYKVGEEVYLTAVDGGQGTMTAGGKSYTMAHPVASQPHRLQGQGGPQQHRRDPDLPAHHRQQWRFQCGGHHRCQRLCCRTGFSGGQHQLQHLQERFPCHGSRPQTV